MKRTVSKIDDKTKKSKFIAMRHEKKTQNIQGKCSKQSKDRYLKKEYY